jgi:hypothetical protein
MEDIEQVGPKTEHIPAKTYQSCSGCKFYDYHMMRSGKNPLYALDCRHPEIQEQKKYDGMFGIGNLGSNREAPDWCPVTTKILNH